MNSFLVALSPVKNTIVTKDDYSIKIHEAFNKIFHEMGINDFRVSSFFGYFFENVFIVDKEKNYKIMITIKKTEYFSSVIQKLFRKALNKEIIFIGENEFKIKGIISNDKIWTGYYNLEEILKKDFDELTSNLKIKIVTPVIEEKSNKFIFEFDKIFCEILKNFSEYCNENFNWINNRKNFLVKKEKYYIKEIKRNKKIKNSYLGEIEIKIIEEQYKNLIYAIFIFAKFYGIGKFSNYGFGQIIIKL